MKFPRIETDLVHPPERVKAALLNKELQPHFKASGWLTQGSVGSKIRWTEQPDGSLSGKLGYFTAKNLSVFRFKVEVAAEGAGSKVVLSAHHGPYSRFLMVLGHVVGFCMFVVGLLFAMLASKAVQRGLRKVVEYVERHLRTWDAAEA